MKTQGDQWQNNMKPRSLNRRWYRVLQHYVGLAVHAYPEHNFRRRATA